MLSTAVFSDIGYFESSPTLAIGVSGGADSMALLLLAQEWASARKGRVIALTVDHGLRKESADEAAQVKKWCEKYSIEHHTLATGDWRPQTGLQEKARNLRYALLSEWCKKNNVLHLLTAHHAGDQAETLLFRLARGSFIEGLACIPAVSVRSGVRLVRPLLGFSKSDLEQFLRAKNQPWIEDPSNQNPHYTRTRIREYLGSETLDARVVTLIASLAAIRHQLEQTLARDAGLAIEMYPDHGFIKQASFRALPERQRLKLLSALTQTIGGGDTQPRSEQLQRLQDELMETPPRARRALGNALFSYVAKKHGFRVEAERKTPHIEQVKPLKPLAGSAFLGLNTAKEHTCRVLQKTSLSG